MTDFSAPSDQPNQDSTTPDSSENAVPQVTEEMIAGIIKTFMLAHEHDSDEHLAQAVVLNAGRLAWRMRELGLTTEYKTSVSDVVTQADRFAEQFVGTVLETLRPNDGLLGEEGTARESASGRVWVIDPVDGTYNFTSGSDYWCSALALVEGDPEDPERVILGAVHRPAMGYTWFGGSEIPTTRDLVPQTVDPSSPDQLSLGGYIHPSDFESDDLTGAWIDVVKTFATQRMLGSASIDMAGVSGGELGCWMQHSVKSWDWLPGRALVEGAGGTTARVSAGGVEWFIAGGDSAVRSVTLSLENYR